MAPTQPYYMIDFSASACSLEIRVNDIPAVTLTLKGQASTRIPVNYLIPESGSQQLSLKILPLLGDTQLLKQKSTASFTLELFNVKNGFEFVENVTDYEMPEIKKDGVPVRMHEEAFAAEVQYGLNAWQDSLNLGQIDDLKEKVKQTGNRLLEMVRNEDYAAFKKALRPHENNMAKSMYLSDKEKKGRVQRLIKDFENEFVPQPIPKEAILQYGANKRIAMLKTPRGKSAIYFHNEELGQNLYLDVMFHKIDNKSALAII